MTQRTVKAERVDAFGNVLEEREVVFLGIYGSRAVVRWPNGGGTREFAARTGLSVRPLKGWRLCDDDRKMTARMKRKGTADLSWDQMSLFAQPSAAARAASGPVKLDLDPAPEGG
jgi:hypothetical protein